jgi:hypothetical protein
VSIKLNLLLDLLKQVNETEEISGKKFDNRYEFEALNDGFGGAHLIEKFPELRERDRHLLYARTQALLDFEVKKYDGRDDYFGSPVSITPRGLEFLETKSQTWWTRQFEALKNNVMTIALSVAITLLSAWALKLTGLNQ